MSTSAHIIYSLDHSSSVKSLPAPIHTDPQIDAQKYQTNSGFLKALVKGTLLR